MHGIEPIEIDLIDQVGGTLSRMTDSGLPDAAGLRQPWQGWTHHLEGWPWPPLVATRDPMRRANRNHAVAIRALLRKWRLRAGTGCQRDD